MTTDIHSACDVFSKVHDHSDGVDGYVSVEADPRLEGYIASDGEHLLPPGREVAAAAMHEAGYEPVAP